MPHFRKLILPLIVLALFGLGSTLTAKADTVTFQIGNNPQANEENILLNSGLSGIQVFGTTNQSNLSVRFSSTTDTLVEPSSGQARVEALDGLVNNITISVPGGSFTDLIMNPFQGSGTATITATTLSNQVLTFQYTLGVGNNFVTIFDVGGAFSSIAISAPGGFTDLRQPRISGAQAIPAAVVEPTTMLLFGAGLSVMAIKLRRRAKRS